MNPVSCIGYIKLIAMYLYIFITLLPQSSLPPSPLPPMPYNEHLYHNIQMYYCRSGNRNWYPMYPSSLYSMNPGHHHPKMLYSLRRPTHLGLAMLYGRSFSPSDVVLLVYIYLFWFVLLQDKKTSNTIYLKRPF